MRTAMEGGGAVEIIPEGARRWVARVQFPSVDALGPEYVSQGDRIDGVGEPLRTLIV